MYIVNIYILCIVILLSHFKIRLAMRPAIALAIGAFGAFGALGGVSFALPGRRDVGLLGSVGVTWQALMVVYWDLMGLTMVIHRD